MENNALQADYTNWVEGKDYPSFMDEISLATISKGYLLFSWVRYFPTFTTFIIFINSTTI